MSDENQEKVLGSGDHRVEKTANESGKAKEKLSVLGPALMIGAFLTAQALVPKEMSWLRVPLFLVLAVVSTLAMLRIQRRYLVVVNDALEKLLTPVFLALFVLISMSPAWVVYSASKWLSESAPRWGQGIVLVLSAGILLFSLHQIYAPGGSEKLFVRLHKQGALAPLVIAVNLLFACVGLFSTFVLVLPGNDTFFVGKPHPHHGEVADFFLWHFFDMIPLFDVNETIKWQAPLTYERKAIGWILVLFKLVVALPVIWLIAAYYTERSTDAPAKKSDAEPKAPSA